MKRKRMTIHEFKGYISGIEVKQISLLTAIQDWYDPASPVQLKLSFPEITVFENPDAIYLSDSDRKNVVSFPNPDHICLENKTIDGSMAFRVVSHTYCGCKAAEVILVVN